MRRFHAGRYGASRRAREIAFNRLREGIYILEGEAVQVPQKVFTHISTKRFINGTVSLCAFSLLSPPFPSSLFHPPTTPWKGRGRARAYFQLHQTAPHQVSPRIKTHWPTLTVMLARKCSFPEFTPLYSRRPRVVYDIYDRVPRNFPRIMPYHTAAPGTKENADDRTHASTWHLSFLRFRTKEPETNDRKGRRGRLSDFRASNIERKKADYARKARRKSRW